MMYLFGTRALRYTSGYSRGIWGQGNISHFLSVGVHAHRKRSYPIPLASLYRYIIKDYIRISVSNKYSNLIFIKYSFFIKSSCIHFLFIVKKFYFIL